MTKARMTHAAKTSLVSLLAAALLIGIVLLAFFPTQGSREVDLREARRHEQESPTSPEEPVRLDVPRPTQAPSSREGPEAVLPANQASTDAPPAPAVLAGYTVGLDDEILAGVSVSLFEPDGQFSERDSSFVHMGESFPEPPSGPLESITPSGLVLLGKSVSDAAGYFEFRVHSSLSSYHFHCMDRERSLSCVGGPFSVSDSPVLLRLDSTYELGGVVRDSETGWGVGGARIDLIEEDGRFSKEAWGFSRERSRVRRTSNPMGGFLFDGIPPGPYRLEILHPSYPAVFRTMVEVHTDLEEFVVLLSRNENEGGALLTGTITDADTGLPIEGAEIESHLGKHKAMSDASGTYRLRMTKEDTERGGGGTFTVRATGYGVAKRDVRGSGKTWEWNAALRLGRVLTCRTVTTSGQPIESAKVVARATLRPGKHTVARVRYYARTGTDGSCTFSELTSGERLEVFAFHPVYGRALEADVPGDTEVLPLELTRGRARVVVAVRDVEGSAVPGAQVLLLETAAELSDTLVRQSVVLGASFDTFGRLRVARTGADGRVTFPGTLEGECLVQALGREYELDRLGSSSLRDALRSETARVDAKPGTRATCDLVLSRSFTLKGRVSTNDGVALEGVVIHLMTLDESGAWTIETSFAISNALGDYRLLGLSPLKRQAVGIQRFPNGGATPQSNRWVRRVAPSANQATGDGQYRNGQSFSVEPRVAKELLFVEEVTATPETRDVRLDISVEASE